LGNLRMSWRTNYCKVYLQKQNRFWLK